MLKELLYPKACVLCDELLEPDPLFGGEKINSKKICKCCEEKYKIIKEPYCMKCGKPLAEETGEYCFDCGQAEFYFMRNRSVFLYEERIRAAMYELKRNHKKENGIFFGEQMAYGLGGWIRELQVDVIIPVPLQKSRLRMRGYNQAGVMARVLGTRLDIAVDEKILARRGRTKAQKKLSRKERKINIKRCILSTRRLNCRRGDKKK